MHELLVKQLVLQTASVLQGIPRSTLRNLTMAVSLSTCTSTRSEREHNSDEPPDYLRFCYTRCARNERHGHVGTRDKEVHVSKVDLLINVSTCLKTALNICRILLINPSDWPLFVVAHLPHC